MAVVNVGTSTATSTVTTMPSRAFSITPSNTDTFSVGVLVQATTAGVVRGIPVNGDGTTTVDFPVGAAGVVACRLIAVKSTGTTATGLVGLLP